MTGQRSITWHNGAGRSTFFSLLLRPSRWWWTKGGEERLLHGLLQSPSVSASQRTWPGTCPPAMGWKRWSMGPKTLGAYQQRASWLDVSLSGARPALPSSTKHCRGSCGQPSASVDVGLYNGPGGSKACRIIKDLNHPNPRLSQLLTSSKQYCSLKAYICSSGQLFTSGNQAHKQSTLYIYSIYAISACDTHTYIEM